MDRSRGKTEMEKIGSQILLAMLGIAWRDMNSAWKSIESITNFLCKNILIIKISIRESRSAVSFDSKRKKDRKKEKEEEEESRKEVEGSGERLHEKKLFIRLSHEKRWLLWQTLYLMHVNRSVENPTMFIGITYNFGTIIIIFIVIITIGIIISIIIIIIIVDDKVYILLIILQLNICKDIWLKKMWMKKRKVV